MSAGFGLDKIVTEFEKNHDDYNSILAKALADRLAEAGAEYLHKYVRTELWGYEQKDSLSNQQLIDEEILIEKNIRPADLSKYSHFALINAMNDLNLTHFLPIKNIIK